ncbi:MAG: hypothetical protein ACW963_06100 [Candidatus Sifarchaeia archaeon]|jgi:hypothetical protein
MVILSEGNKEQMLKRITKVYEGSKSEGEFGIKKGLKGLHYHGLLERQENDELRIKG